CIHRKCLVSLGVIISIQSGFSVRPINSTRLLMLRSAYPRSLAARTLRFVAVKEASAIGAGQAKEPRLAHPAGAVPALAVPSTVLDGRRSGSAAVVALPAAVSEPGLIPLPVTRFPPAGVTGLVPCPVHTCKLLPQ